MCDKLPNNIINKTKNDWVTKSINDLYCMNNTNYPKITPLNYWSRELYMNKKNVFKYINSGDQPWSHKNYTQTSRQYLHATENFASQVLPSEKFKTVSRNNDDIRFRQDPLRIKYFNKDNINIFKKFINSYKKGKILFENDIIIMEEMQRIYELLVGVPYMNINKLNEFTKKRFNYIITNNSWLTPSGSRVNTNIQLPFYNNISKHPQGPYTKGQIYEKTLWNKPYNNIINRVLLKGTPDVRTAMGLRKDFD